MNLEMRPFGTAPDGQIVNLLALRSETGLEVDVITFGGIVTRVLAPDRRGDLADIVLGHDDLGPYLAGTPYFGAIVGRYGNRIEGGRFALDGREHRLTVNQAPHHLHGGERGFDKVVWHAEPYSNGAGAECGVILSSRSPDGDEGYPGELAARVTYALTAAGDLRIEYEAATSAPTVVNLTHHGYWNLAGHAAGSILDHELSIFASRFTPVDPALIPTGELRPVEGTPLDFREATTIGARIEAEDEQIQIAGGYDHNFVLDGWTDDGVLRPAALLHDPQTGRTMEVLTTEPGVQLFSSNFPGWTAAGKGGAKYGHRSALCLETQHFPNSPNEPDFPSTVLRPGETYRSVTVHRFSAE